MTNSPMKPPIKLIVFLATLTMSGAVESSPVAPPNLPPERFKELEHSTITARGMSAESAPATAFGIDPGKFATLQNAIEEAHLSEGEIAALTDRIEELMMQRDKLVLNRALASHPELREEIEIFRRGQSAQRTKGQAALGQRRRDIASGVTPRPDRKKGPD